MLKTFSGVQTLFKINTSDLSLVIIVAAFSILVVVVYAIVVVGLSCGCDNILIFPILTYLQTFIFQLSL